ncbi:DUF6090 family protein [Winogradskyella vincentii]|uniref:Uncharacterized protein n=1 Tax=Winogradskyella vincentii TaxID=2877122 RepID=A0ABS7Y398_9FLAO|nr:DUF6090 family protein [Winogradskyella vincentii]MCA0154405.1 hypothetical protein [Winogradskyella vincentii]
MIKFFRHIRKSLLEQNKMGKYFKYAIGEILLVVIGILIALQINNWNENRKERLQEQELLVQLQSEFTSNLEQLDQKIQMRERMISSSLKLLQYIDRPQTRNNDSILKHAGQIVIAPTFDPIVNDIISSGRIQLLQNASLKEKLSRWTSEIIQVTEEEQVWLNFRSKHYMPTLMEYYSLRNVINGYWENEVVDQFHLDEGAKTKFSVGKSKVKDDFSSLLANDVFEGAVANCASMAKLTNSQSFSLRNRITGILDLIKNELEKLDD